MKKKRKEFIWSKLNYGIYTLKKSRETNNLKSVILVFSAIILKSIKINPLEQKKRKKKTAKITQFVIISKKKKQSSSVSYVPAKFALTIHLDREEKQLPERTSAGPRTLSTPSREELEFDLRALGVSKLRLKTRPMAKMGCSVSLCRGLDDLNFLQKFMWRFRASSVEMSLSDLKTSSFTASTQRPHIQRPW